MKLAIFDIDGTLTNTNGVDSECFIKALAESHAITEINTNWAEYPHTCDSGITLHIFQEKFGRPPEETELRKFKSCFVNLLNGLLSSGRVFLGRGGAGGALAARGGGGGRGGGRRSRRWGGPPRVGVESGEGMRGGRPRRVCGRWIVERRNPASRGGEIAGWYRQDSFDKIVSVGDAVWDVGAAARLKFAFLGVGDGESAARLRQAGARQVIENFIDYAQLVRRLNEAESP